MDLTRGKRPPTPDGKDLPRDRQDALRSLATGISSDALVAPLRFSPARR